MLELLVTSHGSSGAGGVKQGTGCSRGLRAINVPDGRGQRRHSPEERKPRNREEKERKKRREEQFFFQ